MKWQTFRTVLLSAIGGAIVWWIVLGAVFGWMPPGSAERKADERAEAAILDVLTPICVARFNEDTEGGTKLEVLKKSNSWNQEAFVVEQGWTTMPGSEKPETRVVKECASQILATSSS